MSNQASIWAAHSIGCTFAPMADAKASGLPIDWDSEMRTERELRAMGYALADEIATRAAPFMAAGFSPDTAIAMAVNRMAKGSAKRA